MLDNSPAIFQTRPSMRRAYFYALCYAALVCYGRFKTNLEPAFNPVWMASFGLLVVILGVAFLRRWTTLYTITNHEVILTSGIFARHAVAAPTNRITNISGRQSFLERLLGLANLYIDTAGGDQPEIVFPRMTKADASLANEILKKMSTARPTPQSGGYGHAQGS
jgi:uncharacterized membrane protein YdbT with pleckstrin-like domain